MKLFAESLAFRSAVTAEVEVGRFAGLGVRETQTYSKPFQDDVFTQCITRPYDSEQCTVYCAAHK